MLIAPLGVLVRLHIVCRFWRIFTDLFDLLFHVFAHFVGFNDVTVTASLLFGLSFDLTTFRLLLVSPAL